jgi:carbonic anhydrase/acetyltransferase-like protein (isoleucine patch superfamily)
VGFKEETEIELGGKGVYGFHVVVHGGPADFNPTTTGEKVTIKDYAVFFRSKIGDDSVVGCRTLVQQSNLPAGTVIPDKKVILEGKEVGNVEWGECAPSKPANQEDEGEEDEDDNG